MLKVRFAEVSRNAAKSLGINLGAVLDTNNGGATAQTGLFLTNPTAIGGGPINLTSGAFGVGSVFFSVGALTLDLVVDALESKGFARTLAEPTLVALSGDTASFLAGGEVPVPVQSDDGITIEYKQFGISLGFTPTVIDDDLINIQMEAENSQLGDPEQFDVATSAFSLTTRKAKTTVELRDGQSFAIAGLLQEDFQDGISQVPWLGDVPVLGSLFRSTNYQSGQTELVIIISAHLVVPTNENALSLPTDRVRIPRESELFLAGKLESGESASAVSLPQFEGSFGYVME
jgi:pilus assembly protein CpaC